MAAQTVQGSRIVVKLPFAGATDGTDQYVRMKKPVAKVLKFPTAKTSDLFYEVEIDIKDPPPPDAPETGKIVVKRPIRAGYRQRSFRVVFDTPKTLEKQPVGRKYASVSFPVTTSVLVYDVINYFENGDGKDVKVKLLITDEGQSYPINFDAED